MVTGPSHSAISTATSAMLVSWPITRITDIAPEAREYALRFEEGLRNWLSDYDGLGDEECRRLLDCDLLVVHSPFLAERLLALAPGRCERSVVLMTHAPAHIALEIGGVMMPDAEEASWRDEPCVRALIEREMRVMRAVRGVLWPVARAQEGYPGWYRLYREGKARSLFVQHAVPCPAPGTTREAMRVRWGVEPRQRVALFMGRPHPHKGFDRFLDWADVQRREGRTDWVFVHAGRDPGRTRRDLSSIRQVGFEADNGAAYLAADLVLNPNRYSYLDFAVMQCLALGAPLALSPTGGHRDVSELCPRIATIPEGAPHEVWPRLREAALSYQAESGWRELFRQTWERHFSPGRWVRDHLDLYRRLLEAAD